MAPTGRVTVHLSSGEMQTAERLRVEVVGTGVCEEVAITSATRPGVGWVERVAVAVARDAKALRITIISAGDTLGTAEHSLQKVLAQDHEETSLSLTDGGGSAVGSVNAVLRFFHGRSARTVEDEWATLHRQVSRQASLQAQLVR